MYRSLLFDSPEPGTEVDRRMLLGNAGTVTLYVTAGSDAPRFVVAVASSDGVTVASIRTDTRAEALDAYRHPFARPDTPDVFARAAA
jgi:hypothetical protein